MHIYCMDTLRFLGSVRIDLGAHSNCAETSMSILSDVCLCISCPTHALQMARDVFLL